MSIAISRRERFPPVIYFYSSLTAFIVCVGCERVAGQMKGRIIMRISDEYIHTRKCWVKQKREFHHIL